MDRRTATLLAAVALPPLAFLATGQSPAPPLAAGASILAVSAALAILERDLRTAGLASVSVATAILALYGTGLVWHEVAEPDLTALTLVGGTLLVRAWSHRVSRERAAAIASGAVLGMVLAGLSLVAEVGTGAHPALGRPALLDSLFSSRHGLFFWAPLLTIAVCGLVLRAWRGRRDAAGALSALGTLALVSASLRPWWSGGLGNARFLPALPLFALGLATALGRLRSTAERRPLQLAALAGAVLVAWNLLLMAQYRAELIPRDDTVSFPAVAENSARLLAEIAGAPTAWPANWIFAAGRPGAPRASTSAIATPRPGWAGDGAYGTPAGTWSAVRSRDGHGSSCPWWTRGRPTCACTRRGRELFV
ncbi:MAG: hypothetical protein DMF77_20800 [Acidobacteria bacterium]|nr:MAG: hypothetical protein DMF77_20800 [Acidobacteriota bacterium]